MTSTGYWYIICEGTSVSISGYPMLVCFTLGFAMNYIYVIAKPRFSSILNGLSYIQKQVLLCRVLHCVLCIFYIQDHLWLGSFRRVFYIQNIFYWICYSLLCLYIVYDKDIFDWRCCALLYMYNLHNSNIFEGVCNALLHKYILYDRNIFDWVCYALLHKYILYDRNIFDWVCYALLHKYILYDRNIFDWVCYALLHEYLLYDRNIFDWVCYALLHEYLLYDRNIFDWVCYALLLVVIITHLVDIFHHSNTLARVHIRIMAITIILIWIRLLKNFRAFSLLGE